MTLAKTISLTTVGLVAWVSPALFRWDVRVEGVALAIAPMAFLGAAHQARRDSLTQTFQGVALRNETELALTRLEVSHQLELQRAYSLLYPQHEEPQPDTPQPQLTGAHLGQPHLPSPGETEEIAWDWATIAPLILTHPATLLVGAQGAGKTTLAQWVVNQKLNQGEEVVVLDPHWAKGEWPGCQIVGAGQNYTAIDQYLTHVLAEVKNRYRQREQGVMNFDPLTLVCEELTQWGDRVKAVEPFMLSSMSDFRKVGIRAVFLSHGKTNKTMGDGKGLAATREATLITLELRAKPTTDGPRPSGWAILSVPGFAPTRIQIPDLRGESGGEPTPAIVAQPAPPTHDQGETVGWLDRCLAATPPAPDWATPLIEWVKTQGGEVTVRQCQQWHQARKWGWKSLEIQNAFTQAEAIRLGFATRNNGEITGFRLLR